MIITTIIPTLCEAKRKDNLLRAIQSIHHASTEPVRVLIVVNGQRFDAELLENLRTRRDVDILQIVDGSLCKAHLSGRRDVKTEFYSFLDDDDEYLPAALDVRLSIMRKDKTVDLVVTNGYQCGSGADRLLYTRLANVSDNPLKELFQENWLHNCNHLFRSSSVPISYYEDPHPYMEWTWLAFRLAIAKKTIGVTNVPTFRYHDTPGSLSKSPLFCQSGIDLYGRMLSSKPGREIERVILRKLSNGWHEISVLELGRGNRTKALAAHVRSLTCHWSGFKYLPYTTQLFC